MNNTWVYYSQLTCQLLRAKQKKEEKNVDYKNAILSWIQTDTIYIYIFFFFHNSWDRKSTTCTVALGDHYFFHALIFARFKIPPVIYIHYVNSVGMACRRGKEKRKKKIIMRLSFCFLFFVFFFCFLSEIVFLFWERWKVKEKKKKIYMGQRIKSI